MEETFAERQHRLARQSAHSGLNFHLGKHVRDQTDITIHRPGIRAYSIPFYGRVYREGRDKPWGTEQVGWVVVTLLSWLHSPPRAEAKIVYRDEFA